MTVLGSLRLGFRKLRYALQNNPNRFLLNVPGVVHVGANTGQERDLYAHLGLKVLWVEPLPEIFKELEINISGFPSQRAVNALVTDANDQEYVLRIANNQGASSSIFELKMHRDIWPEVAYIGSLRMRSTTLIQLLEQQNCNPEDLPALVMDTQGAELLILQGAKKILNRFRYVKAEVADFEAYAGCCQFAELKKFMIDFGFDIFNCTTVASHPSGGRYFDVVFKRTSVRKASLIDN
jgi:FkbM family methyltransferase